MARFLVEATWSGYRSSQSRVCHREIIHKRMAERLKKVVGFRFSDGTNMTLEVRQCKPREKVAAILGYSRVIHNASYKQLEGFLDIMDVRL